MDLKMKKISLNPTESVSKADERVLVEAVAVVVSVATVDGDTYLVFLSLVTVLKFSKYRLHPRNHMK